MSEVRERRFRWPVVAGLGAAVAALVLVLVTVVSGIPNPSRRDPLRHRLR
ncbi:hypothetical protein ACFSVJ_14605 [Prauserella oleivorans]